MIISNKKREAILVTAKELFWKYGFRRVSVEEICKKAGVSKMTYYKFFPNKIELAKTVFKYLVEESQVKFKNLMEEEIPVDEKIRKVILFKAEATENISQEFLQDFYMGSEPELKLFVEQMSKNALDDWLSDYRAAQKKGIFRDDFKPEFLLQASFKLIELLKDEKLMKLYNDPQELILEFVNLLTYGISSHK